MIKKIKTALKNKKNERIGIATIIIVILFSILILSYFLGYFSTNIINPNAPIEAPNPPYAGHKT